MTFRLNGAEEVLDVPAGTTLLEAIRGAGLTGTKEGCRIGVCGLCTVLVGGLPVSSCIFLTACAEGTEVWTVEGLAADRPELVEAFVAYEAMQCGICTPGQMVMAAAAGSELGRGASEREVREYLAGNLCRCTGYATIVEALGAALGAGSREPVDASTATPGAGDASVRGAER
ncbi:MAG: (2Fe-2S)-binding protein [Acidimicrobiales bacterium]